MRSPIYAMLKGGVRVKRDAGHTSLSKALVF